MELVIKIPESHYNQLRKQGSSIDVLRQAVIDGTPLPKGHGDMVDVRDISAGLEGCCSQFCNDCGCRFSVHSKCDLVYNAPVLVKEDKEA